MGAINPVALFGQVIGGVIDIIKGNRASATARGVAAEQARVGIAQVAAEKEIALKDIELQSEIFEIEATSQFGQTFSEGLELLADQLGITQPIVLETAPKEPANFTPIIIGGIAIMGVLFLLK